MFELVFDECTLMGGHYRLFLVTLLINYSEYGAQFEVALPST